MVALIGRDAIEGALDDGLLAFENLDKTPADEKQGAADIVFGVATSGGRHDPLDLGVVSAAMSVLALLM